MLAFETGPFLVAEAASDTHEIGGDDRDPDPARKSIGTEGPDPLQAVVREPIDGRFNGGMRLPCGGEFGGLFAGVRVGGRTPLPEWYGRQRHTLPRRGQRCIHCWTPEALVQLVQAQGL